VSISRLSTVCHVCSVHLTEVIAVFPSNKWEALKEPVDVLCVWSTIRQAVTDDLHFWQGSALTLFGWSGRVYIFGAKFPQGCVHQKLLKLVHFRLVIQTIKGAF